MKEDLKIIKRDGKKVAFCKDNLYRAIQNVFVEFETYEALDINSVLEKVCNRLNNVTKKEIEVEEIQDIVEQTLLAEGYSDVAERFADFRKHKEMSRDAFTKKQKGMVKAVEKLTKDSVLDTSKRENANIDGDTAMGTMLQFGSTLTRAFAQSYLINPKAAAAHDNGEIHIHDMDFTPMGTTTCLAKDDIVIIVDNSEDCHQYRKCAYFDKFFADNETEETWKTVPETYILGRNGWTMLRKVMRRKIKPTERMYQIITKNGRGIKVTENHKIPVFRDGREILVSAKELQVGDGMLSVPVVNEDDDSIMETVTNECIEHRIEERDVISIPGYKTKSDKIKSIELITYKGFVYDLETAEHWFVANGYVVHNCTQIPLNKLFKRGFFTGHGYLRPPKGILTYAALACIAIQSNQNDQHGGQSIPAFDYYMAPGVLQTFQKELKQAIWDAFDTVDALDYLDRDKLVDAADGLTSISSEPRLLYCCVKPSSFDNETQKMYKIIDKAFSRTVLKTNRLTYQAMEAFIHNLNTMACRAGAQVPFSSVNFGTDTSPEGRMVIKNFLLAVDAGLGHGETSIFPISIFKVKEGVNYNVGDPNYDLLQLAAKVTSKRLFPNFGFIDAPFNKQYYKPDDYNTEIAYMGCAAGCSVITVKNDIGTNTNSMASIYEIFAKKYPDSVFQYGVTTYVDLENKDIEIYDTASGGFVKLKKILKNPNRNNWYKLSTSDGNILYLTEDHPLKIEDRGRTLVKDISVGDQVFTANDPLAFISADNCRAIYDNAVMQQDLSKTQAYYARLAAKSGNNQTVILREIENKLILAGFHKAQNDEALTKTTIAEIERVDLDECSYDVETASDMFDLCGIVSHNCRTRVIGNIVNPKNEVVTGRGNLSFTSINLPRLGIKHGIAAGEREQADWNGFYEELDNLMDLVKHQLLERFEIQCKKHVYNFPFLMGSGVWINSEKLNKEDTLRKVLKEGTLSIGFIGLAECLKAMTGKHHGEDDETQKIGLEIIGHMRSKCDEYAEKLKLNFSLLATPAEGLSGRFINIDKGMYGEIPGVTDKEYYTNSFHVPVYYPISVEQKLRKEAPYHELTNAGHISYIELDGLTSENPEAVMDVIRIMHDAGIGYGAINHPVDRDPVCGYTGIIEDVCPCCGRKEEEAVPQDSPFQIDGRSKNPGEGIKFERIRRITGYLVGTLDRFNSAKAAEERDRVKHTL